MRVDLLFSAAGRPEFTRESLASLKQNTDWNFVRAMWIYLDGYDHETRDVVTQWMRDFRPVRFYVFPTNFGSPVAIMRDWLETTETYDKRDELILAKIDNDVIVPRSWLASAGEVMNSRPELDLLGLEPPLSRTPAPWEATKRKTAAPELDRARHIMSGWNGYARCPAVGGVGLFRRRAFAQRRKLVSHSIYGGFTEWQTQHPDLVIGWIVPPMPLFLLDRLPMEPWASLSKRYIAQGKQRIWTNYGPEASALWGWWTPAGC